MCYFSKTSTTFSNLFSKPSISINKAAYLSCKLSSNIFHAADRWVTVEASLECESSVLLQLNRLPKLPDLKRVIPKDEYEVALKPALEGLLINPVPLLFEHKPFIRPVHVGVPLLLEIMDIADPGRGLGLGGPSESVPSEADVARSSGSTIMRDNLGLGTLGLRG